MTVLRGTFVWGVCLCVQIVILEESVVGETQDLRGRKRVFTKAEWQMEVTVLGEKNVYVFYGASGENATCRGSGRSFLRIASGSVWLVTGIMGGSSRS